MIFSNTVAYAIRGLSELAARGASGKRVLLDDLVVGSDLPRDFLAKIFQRLAKAGIVASAKGRGGGFLLARATHQVTLLQIVEAIDGPSPEARCAIGLATCDDAQPCAMHDLYKPIRQRLKDHLRTTTLADLASSLRSKPGWTPAARGAKAKAGEGTTGG